jgi:hypothetical protein
MYMPDLDSMKSESTTLVNSFFLSRIFVFNNLLLAGRECSAGVHGWEGGAPCRLLRLLRQPWLPGTYIHTASDLALLNPDQDRPLGYRRPVSGPGPDAESERWELAPDPYHSDKQDPDTDPHQSDKQDPYRSATLGTRITSKVGADVEL